DNMNDYYDVGLKNARLDILKKQANFVFHEFDLADHDRLTRLFADETFDKVLHLAAQAGVRYAFKDPHSYGRSNLTAFINILEVCRHNAIRHLVYASSSSVYGGNTKLPFSESDPVDHPVSLYAATKKSNELMAHTYAHLFRLPVTGLRFFTVYGPWGRPDMSLFLFTRKIFAGEAIDVFNNGQHGRDFTYIDDIVEGVIRTLDTPAVPDPSWDSDRPDPATSNAPYRVLNIGNNKPVELMDFIGHIEKAIGRTAEKNFLPLQPGDVERTFANIDKLSEVTGFTPKTPIEEGIKRFVAWYRDFYDIRDNGGDARPASGTKGQAA
ncbi:MAG: NAD-dependent epimerase, partial [Alphaproteobacteria bacterium]|nr:NAD-dependent epimerase [Alphaproteobacteria bacterium]